MSLFSQSRQKIASFRFVSFLEDTKAVDKYLEKKYMVLLQKNAFQKSVNFFTLENTQDLI